jgi:CheY-like chemotaxis protein
MAKKRLLVIEDDVDVGEMLVAYLASQQYEVYHAEFGADGIALARAKFPNLVLLDVMLPDIDGFDVARRLRTTMITRHLPITFLTQRDERSSKLAGLELGADDYVTKPFDLEELRLRIQSSLNRSTREHLYDPTSGLAARKLLELEIPRMLAEPSCAGLEAEIIGYEAFREVYGFVAAETLLNYWGQILRETLMQFGTDSDLAGTLSEDRYVILTYTTRRNQLIESLLQRFDSDARTFYSFIDRERGYVPIHGADGSSAALPLMHLKIKPLVDSTQNAPATA